MIRATLPALAALMLSVPALAQPADPALREMRRERGNPTVPAVPAQNRNAAEADADGVQTARGLLTEARAALIRRSAGRAIEALERAETRLLTNSVVASEAARPQGGAALSLIGQARRLAGQGDTRSALAALDRAEAALIATPTGPGAQPLPEGVPTAVDAPPPVPPSQQRAPRRVRPEGARPAVPPGPGIPAETMPRG